MEASSYKDIALSIGVDSPSQILFATDNILEGQAAKEAGWQVAMTVRPGNKALPSNHSFRVVSNMNDLLSSA